MIRSHVLSLLAITMIFTTGCAKEEEAPAPPPEKEPSKVVDYTDESVEVSASDITPNSENMTGAAASKGMVVKADFNLDGKQDIAMVEEKSDGEREVTLYIQKSPEDEETADGKKTIYFRGGSIRAPINGQIIGIMSKRTGNYTDLLVLASGGSSGDDIIHYRNDGKRFTRVEE